QKVTRVRCVGRHMIFGASVKVLFAARRRRRQSLILRAQIPPAFVVVLWFDFAGENFPTPLIDEITKRQKRNFIERTLQQKSNVRVLVRHLIDQTDLLKVRWRY